MSAFGILIAHKKTKSSYVITKYKMPTLGELYMHCFKEELDTHFDSEYIVNVIIKCFFYLMNNE